MATKRKKHHHATSVTLRVAKSVVTVLKCKACRSSGKIRFVDCPDDFAVTFDHDPSLHDCPALRLALARCGMAELATSCSIHP